MDSIFCQSRVSDSINRKRLGGLILGEALLYSGAMTWLYGAWYSGYPHSRFHFFNDNSEWLQMDKLGHLSAGYYLGLAGYEGFRWSGLRERESLFYGVLPGLCFLTTIEVFDGFSSQWGFSYGDVFSNVFGAGVFASQQLMWNQQRILLKWSFHQSEYSDYRPDLLGRGLHQNVIKDYNGQTYWLSANIKSFFWNNKSHFPGWLSFAIGYGADGMLGGRDNPLMHDGKLLPIAERTRRFLVSPDIDLTKINTRNKTINMLLHSIGFMKFPLPAIEYRSDGKFKLHYIYF